MGAPPLPAGLYVITDNSLIPEGDLVECVAQAIDGGAAVIQYREKHRPWEDRCREAATLATLCRHRGIPLIINDDIELARATGADGVHLGREDIAISQARKRLGPQAIIGISCYNRLDRALQASQEGADYVAFGRFYPSVSKPDAVRARPALLEQAREMIDLPVVAIGGITPGNAGELRKAGADLLAVIHGVFGQADIRAAAAAYAPLFGVGGKSTKVKREE